MTTHPHQTGLAAIAVFKLVKGVLLLLVGVGLLKLMHAEITALLSRLIEGLHLNADSRIIHAVVLKADALQPHSVLAVGLVSLGYAGCYCWRAPDWTNDDGLAARDLRSSVWTLGGARSL